MARGEHEIPSTETWLTADEVRRVADLRFTKRRTEYLLRRWVCKQAVVAATGMSGDVPSLARVEVANHPGGAPYVQLDGAPLPLDVSLSDRAGWAVCVVAEKRGRVGCDVEIVEPRSAGFVADFLTPAEQDYVASRPDDDRQAAANLIWSAKESALKVLQTGLRRDTRSVEVLVAPARGEDVASAAGGLASRSGPPRAASSRAGGGATGSSWSRSPPSTPSPRRPPWSAPRTWPPRGRRTRG